MFRRPPAKEIWEVKAAELVGEVLGGEFTRHDDGSQDGMVDFIGQTQVVRLPSRSRRPSTNKRWR